MVRVVRYLIPLFVLCLLAGCSTVPVAEDVSQNQANEIVAVLSEQGIAANADKETGSRGKYVVSVRRELYHEAIEFLHAKGLPSPQEPTFAETVASKGFLPNSRDIEALRVDRALAAELEEVIKSHPSVKTVKVVVRRAFPGDGSISVASIVERRMGALIESATITDLIKGAVPGIAADKVTVTLVDELPKIAVDKSSGVENRKGITVYIPLSPFLGFFRVAEGDLQALSIAVLVGMLVVGAVGAFLGYWYGYLHQSQVLMEPLFPEMTKPVRQIGQAQETGEEDGK